MEFKQSISQKLRMKGRDYSRPGWYFVTMCADYHHHLFGAIRGVEMVPNELGALVECCWAEIPMHYRHIVLGEKQLMPNHFHGILRIRSGGNAALGEVLNMFKGSVTRLWRKRSVSRSGESSKIQIWAPNYWDVICFDAEQLEVRENYVRANPRRWALKKVPEGQIKRCLYKGNKELLQATLRCKLRVSRRATEAEIETLKSELSHYEGVVCSTFFSLGERECLKTLLAGSSRVIWFLPMAMPETIPVAWTEAFLKERALWLSAFDEPKATRANCMRANDWVERFCAEVSRQGGMSSLSPWRERAKGGNE